MGNDEGIDQPRKTYLNPYEEFVCTWCAHQIPVDERNGRFRCPECEKILPIWPTLFIDPPKTAIEKAIEVQAMGTSKDKNIARMYERSWKKKLEKDKVYVGQQRRHHWTLMQKRLRALEKEATLD